MTNLLALLIVTTVFVSLEAAPANITAGDHLVIAGARVVFDVKYDDKKKNANAATKDMIFKKLSEATNKNGPSKLIVYKMELRNVKGYLAAVYTVTAPNCEEVDRDAREILRNYKPAMHIKYNCIGEIFRKEKIKLLEAISLV